MRYLYAAYIATWAIHAAYLGYLARRYSRLKREVGELKRKG
jgi:CcmD family protein